MERIVVFLDYANASAALRAQGTSADYADLLSYLGEGRFLVEAQAYVPIDPRNPHGRDRETESLWRSGWLVHTKVGSIAGDTYKCDFDVEITLDLMRTAEIVKPDIVVLISGDKDFIPVMLELRRRGIRVEVAAIPDCNAAREVILKASGFIDLRAYVDESHGVDDDEPESGPSGGELDPGRSDVESESCEHMEADQPAELVRTFRGATAYPRPPVART